MNAAEERAWRARASRFRREHGDYCEWCEWRDWVICRKPRIVWRARLQVHHGYGKGWLSPIGQEMDYELHVACLRCHRRITRDQLRRARRAGCLGEGGKIVDRAVYGECVRRATAAASVRRWARGWHRTLLGEVPVRVLDKSSISA